jgi:hypothetical protein
VRTSFQIDCVKKHLVKKKQFSQSEKEEKKEKRERERERDRERRERERGDCVNGGRSGFLTEIYQQKSRIGDGRIQLVFIYKKPVQEAVVDGRIGKSFH